MVREGKNAVLSPPQPLPQGLGLRIPRKRAESSADTIPRGALLWPLEKLRPHPSAGSFSPHGHLQSRTFGEGVVDYQPTVTWRNPTPIPASWAAPPAPRVGKLGGWRWGSHRLPPAPQSLTWNL